MVRVCQRAETVRPLYRSVYWSLQINKPTSGNVFKNAPGGVGSNAALSWWASIISLCCRWKQRYHFVSVALKRTFLSGVCWSSCSVIDGELSADLLRVGRHWLQRDRWMLSVFFKETVQHLPFVTPPISSCPVFRPPPPLLSEAHFHVFAQGWVKHQETD